MQQKNKFDLVMDYIDANIQNDVEIIKKGIYDLIGYNSNSFGRCLLILTGVSLKHYIITRRMYFAARELCEIQSKPISEIALEYGYSEQSAFSRAMKVYFDCTPNEVRKGKVKIQNNKFSLSDLHSKANDTRTNRILNILENNGILSSYNMELIMGLEEATEEYGFDIDTCYQIADLAERLEIEPLLLIDKCFDMILEQETNPNINSPKTRVAIECGIESTEELNEICEYFNCEYYDLDQSMVAAYKKQRR